MKTLMLVASLGLAGTAGATQLDFSVSYPLTARAGVSDFGVLGGKLSAGLSSRGADVGYSRGLALPPLGAVSVSSQVQVAWGGGIRLSGTGTGTVGPIALNLGAAYFTTAATTFDPLAGWTLTPTDLREHGGNADLSLRYRVSRPLVALVGGEFGPQNNGFAGVEYRRDLTRTLPPAEGDDPTAPAETERIGTLTYRAGLRAGRNVLGITGGVSYAREDGKTFALDAQVGPSRGGHSGLGLVGSATFPELLGEGSSLKAYAAYEPWREYTAALRVGLEASKPLGPGTLSVKVRGGQNLAQEMGFGFSVGYSFPLGGQTEEP